LDAVHTPVLVEEVIRLLRIKPDGIYVDATVGLGGHSGEIAARLTTGKLIGMDRDARALEIARERLKEFEKNVTLVHANFDEIDSVVKGMGLPPADGVLADLGVSSMQLDQPERGFSFRAAGPLDMRMNGDAADTQALTADDIVNGWDESDLADVLYQYGEEHDSRRIARTIVRARPIRSTEHLATVVAGARHHGGRQKLHPATKTFLALRIAVNRELEALEQFLLRTPATLNSEGRMVVMSYHSLEDRRVKYFFREQAAAGVLQIVTTKAVQATDDEINRNHRARSVKLRAAEKMAGGQ
jgi:16S rRNA (cytosine1402-N4)-methyltransferase